MSKTRDMFPDCCTGCVHMQRLNCSWTNSSTEFAKYSTRYKIVEFEVEYVIGMCRCKSSPKYNREVVNTRFKTYATPCKYKITQAEQELQELLS